MSKDREIKVEFGYKCDICNQHKPCLYLFEDYSREFYGYSVEFKICLDCVTEMINKKVNRCIKENKTHCATGWKCDVVCCLDCKKPCDYMCFEVEQLNKE